MKINNKWNKMNSKMNHAHDEAYRPRTFSLAVQLLW